MSLSRNKMMGVSSEICADCSAPNPNWASVSRMVLLCSECTSIHRSLGRHISAVKSLRKGRWHPNLLAVVFSLNNSANNIWEHSLLDPQSSAKIRRKPNPRDPLYPIKADFIRAKYQNLSFCLKPAKDKNTSAAALNDFNRQLHSCVRTSHIETTLRLLALGANPNYFDPEKGTTPCHVAAKEGQILQIELLCVYGADPAMPDFSGKTPGDYAKAERHLDILDRLVELEHELTDELTFHLCGRTPEHGTGQHYLIPEVSSNASDNSKGARLAKSKLQNLSDVAFEAFAMDVYDEVDRRETDAAWLASQSQNALINDRFVAPFLPVNQEFSATRNQGRQKLAKLNSRDFAALIIDVLSEVKRRQSGISVIPSDQKTASVVSDPGCDMSSGAGENTSGPIPRGKSRSKSGGDSGSYNTGSDHKLSLSKEVKAKSSESLISDDGPVYDEVPSDFDSLLLESEVPISNGKEVGAEAKTNPVEKTKVLVDAISRADYEELKHSVLMTNNQVQELARSNEEIMRQLSTLHYAVNKMFTENLVIRAQTEDSELSKSISPSLLSNAETTAASFVRGSPVYSQPVAIRSSKQTSASDNSLLAAGRGSKSASYSDPADEPTGTAAAQRSSAPTSVQLSTYDSREELKLSRYTDRLIVQTEELTKEIQKLLSTAQEGAVERFPGLAARVQRCCDLMVSSFPENIRRHNESVEKVLNQMVDASIHLTILCSRSPEWALEQFAVQVVHAAYDVAKSAKQLLMLIQGN